MDWIYPFLSIIFAIFLVQSSSSLDYTPEVTFCVISTLFSQQPDWSWKCQSNPQFLSKLLMVPTRCRMESCLITSKLRLFFLQDCGYFLNIRAWGMLLVTSEYARDVVKHRIVQRMFLHCNKEVSTPSKTWIKLNLRNCIWNETTRLSRQSEFCFCH